MGTVGACLAHARRVGPYGAHGRVDLRDGNADLISHSPGVESPNATVNAARKSIN